MSAIEVTTETKINHAELGTEVWEWNADQQAAFLAAFATAFSKDAGVGVMQIHYIADELRKNRYNLAAVRWLNDRLTEYLVIEP